MPINSQLFNIPYLSSLLSFALMLILIFYSLFSLLVVRQVDIMSKTLITPVSPVVKAFSIIHAGFAIGFTVFMLGVLF